MSERRIPYIYNFSRFRYSYMYIMQGRRKQIQSGPAIFQLFSTITPTATHRKGVAARGVWGHAPSVNF